MSQITQNENLVNDNNEETQSFARRMKSALTARKMKLTDVWNPKTRLFINLSLIALVCCEAIFANFYSELNLSALSSMAPSAVSHIEESGRGPSILAAPKVHEGRAHRSKPRHQEE